MSYLNFGKQSNDFNVHWECFELVHIIKINLLGMFTNLQASMLTRDQLKTQPEGELKTTE